MNALRDFFPGHLISHLGDVAWPGQSPGQNACDFLIRSYLKSKGFVTTCNTNAELVNYVKDMSTIRRYQQTLSKDWGLVWRSELSHLSDLIFNK